MTEHAYTPPFMVSLTVWTYDVTGDAYVPSRLPEYTRGKRSVKTLKAG